MRPFTLEVFVPSGDPDGVLVASMNNWLGKATIFPRGLIGEVKGRKEFQQPGVYILIGGGKIYIGEGDPVGPRLESHVRQKDFWRKAIFFNSEAGRLNKAHVQHLESRLVQIAKEAGKAALENGNMPIAPALSESEHAFAENFLNDILLILPLLGFHQLELREEEDAVAQEDDQIDITDGFEGKRAGLYSSLPKGMQFKMNWRNLDSTLEIVDGGVIVKKGSQAMEPVQASFELQSPAYAGQRRQLVESGIIKVEDGKAFFTDDQFFSSGSAASAVVRGRTSNANRWVSTDGTSLGDLIRKARGRA
jgi:predicted nucleic acid-binding protein